MENLNRYYEILDVSLDSSVEEIKQAYRDLVKVWHPDRFAHDPKLQKKAQEKLKEINEAYQKIQDFLNNPYQKATKPNGNEYARAGETFQSDTKQSTGSNNRKYRSTSQQRPYQEEKHSFTQNIRSIEIGNLFVVNDGFYYLNQKYTYDQIKHITFYWEKCTHTVNGISSKTEEAFLEITLCNDQKLKESFGQHGLKAITTVIPFYNTFAKTDKKCEILAEACKLLSLKTFDRRFLYYANQLENNGYFVYADKYFFYDGRVVSGKKGEFRITDNPSIRPFTLTLSKSKSQLQKLVTDLVGGIYDLVISLKTDRDVFLALYEILRKR